MGSHELRPVDDDDHPFLVELHNDPLVLKNLTDPRPITMDTHMEWWSKRVQRCEDHHIFTVDGARVGMCKFAYDEQNGSACLGADIHVDYRGRGLARPMWTLMVTKAFARGMHRVWLTTADYNVIGQRVYSGVGFRVEGRLEQSLYRDGAYHDQIVMRLLRQEWMLLHGFSKE